MSAERPTVELSKAAWDTLNEMKVNIEADILGELGVTVHVSPDEIASRLIVSVGRNPGFTLPDPTLREATE